MTRPTVGGYPSSDRPASDLAPPPGGPAPGAHPGEHDPLLRTVVKALEPYDIPTGAWSAAEKIEPARKVLEALGIEQIGWVQFPVPIGNPVRTEMYADRPGYEPVYRLKAQHSDSEAQP